MTADEGVTQLSFERVCKIFGNGDILHGKQLLLRIADKLIHARSKHPEFAIGVYQGLSRITSEHEELVFAVEHETIDRQFDEDLDVIATAVRFANKEYEVDS